MTNHGEDHWDLLASDLGATPPPRDDQEKSGKTQEDQPEADDSLPAQVEPESGQGEPAPEKPSTKAQPRSPDTESKRRRPTSSWAELAKRLGVVCPEETTQPEPVGHSSASYIEAELVEAAAEEASVMDEAFDVFAETAEETPETPIESEDTSNEAAETKSGRKRRRRRRPRKSEDESTETITETITETTARVAEDEAADLIVSLTDPTLEPGEPADTDSSPPKKEDDSAGRTKKRRRRRRTAKTTDAVKSGDELPKTKRPEAVRSEVESEEEPVADKPSDTRAKPIGAKADPRPKPSAKTAGSIPPSHRGIPSWEEAVNTIISRNMESRKNLNGGSSPRSRGGRSRAGRAQSAPKKTT